MAEPITKNQILHICKESGFTEKEARGVLEAQNPIVAYLTLDYMMQTASMINHTGMPESIPQLTIQEKHLLSSWAGVEGLDIAVVRHTIGEKLKGVDIHSTQYLDNLKASVPHMQEWLLKSSIVAADDMDKLLTKHDLGSIPKKLIRGPHGTRNHKVGDTVTLPNNASFSTDERVAHAFSVTNGSNTIYTLPPSSNTNARVIEVPNEIVGLVTNEHEFLVDTNNIKFKVVKVDTIDVPSKIYGATSDKLIEVTLEEQFAKGGTTNTISKLKVVGGIGLLAAAGNYVENKNHHGISHANRELANELTMNLLNVYEKQYDKYVKVPNDTLFQSERTVGAIITTVPLWIIDVVKQLGHAITHGDETLNNISHSIDKLQHIDRVFSDNSVATVPDSNFNPAFSVPTIEDTSCKMDSGISDNTR